LDLFPHEAEYSGDISPTFAEKKAEYVEMIRDCIELGHNVILARHFHKLKDLDKKKPSRNSQSGNKNAVTYVDIWLLPVKMLEQGGQQEHAKETLSTLLLLGNILQGA
jgi:hypothetical protein